MIVPSMAIAADPCDGRCVIEAVVRVPPSGSVSLSTTATLTESSPVVTLSSTAIGERSIAVTLTVTWPHAVPPALSEIMYSNASGPLYSGAGVYVTEPSDSITAAPFAGTVTDATDRTSPSTSPSFASTARFAGVSLSVAMLSSPAFGGSLTGVTSTVTVAVDDLPAPSETV